MPAVLIKLLLAVAVLVHTVLGCCWHHAHPPDACNGVAAATPTRHACGGHSHEHVAPSGNGHESHIVTGDSDQQAPRHEHRHLCNEPDCMYVAGKSVRLENSAATMWCVAGRDSRCDIALSASPIAATDPGRAPVQPAGLRAALQVWLI